MTILPGEIEPLLLLIWVEQSFTPMRGNWPRLTVRAVRLLVFRKRLFDRVQRLLQYILQKRLRGEQQHT